MLKGWLLMNKKLNYNKRQFLIFIVFAIFFLFIIFHIYNQKNKPAQISSSNQIADTPLVSVQTVSDSDIEEAKKVIEDYFYELKTSDSVILKKYLGYNMINIGDIGPCNVNGSNSSLAFLYDNNFKPELIKIDTSPKYRFDPSYYANEIKNQNNIDVYKIIDLHVYFNYIKDRDWDFILVKYTEASSWKIHYWID
jgi:hypothetical protein